MDVQRFPLRDQEQYCLDGAIEYGELSSHHATAVELYADRDAVAAIWEAPIDPKTRSWRRDRLLKCEATAALAEQILPQLSPLRRAAMAVDASRFISYRVNEFANYLARSVYEDMTCGGAHWPFKKVRCCDKQFHPTPGARRKLIAPAFIRRMVRCYDVQDTEVLRRVAASFMTNAFPLIGGFPPDQILAERDRMCEDIRGQRWRRDEEVRKSLGSAAAMRRRLDKKANKVVRRAAVMAAALLGASTVSAFARGQAVTLPGKECALVVTKASRLHAVGHGGLSVTATTLDGKPMADLCVYFGDTPALDQLTAFALFAAAGEEFEVLKQGNLIRVHADGVGHPLIEARAAQRLEARAAAMARVIAGDGGPDDAEIARDNAMFNDLLHRGWDSEAHALKMRRAEEYWQATKHIWLDALRLHCFGRRAKIMAILGDRVQGDRDDGEGEQG